MATAAVVIWAQWEHIKMTRPLSHPYPGCNVVYLRFTLTNTAAQLGNFAHIIALFFGRVFHSIPTETRDGFVVGEVKQARLVGGYNLHLGV